jgi:phenylpropionate dioxygenase-like ring-hydroxylating dioxygenase large terminal subunit
MSINMPVGKRSLDEVDSLRLENEILTKALRDATAQNAVAQNAIAQNTVAQNAVAQGAVTENLAAQDPDYAHETAGVGSWLLKNIWYYATPSESLKVGKTIAKVMLGEPILIGRDQNGVVFAMRDICPHQGVPLSDGSFDGQKIGCCFHGWCFDTAGVCTDIPSLADGQSINMCSIKTKSYPCRESQGSVFIYFGDGSHADKRNLPDPPQAPGLDGIKWNKTTTTLLLPTHIDYAVAALIDPAHVPYVHKSWWWRSTATVYLKEKLYKPDGNGWTMVRHLPSKNAQIFKALGDKIETEIGFRLPGCRLEQIIFNGRTLLSGLTCLTPIDDTHTELTHTTYWTVPGLSIILRPIINYFVHEFLGQDRDIAKRQEKVLKYKTPMIMTIPDAGTPGRWYFQLKKEWAEAHSTGRPFRNPVIQSVLRWKT